MQQKRIAVLVCLVFCLALSACQFPTGAGGVQTYTPLPSATPTCAANFLLSTPQGWDAAPRFVVILFDPTSIRDGSLELLNGESTSDVSEFVYELIPLIVRPGDQVSVFQLGFRTYEAARVVRVFSYAERPQLYDTPSPLATVTPIATRASTPEPGLPAVAATNEFRANLTEQAEAAAIVEALDGCARKQWDDNAKLTATAWSATETTELGSIDTQVNGNATEFVENTGAIETPYSRQVVYDGLGHASTDFRDQCSSYDKCILVIVDDLETWGLDNPNNLAIDLTGVEIYSIMPNCKDINQPSCTRLQEYWNIEFEKFGTSSVVYSNGVRAEFNILDFLGR